MLIIVIYSTEKHFKYVEALLNKSILTYLTYSHEFIHNIEQINNYEYCAKIILAQTIRFYNRA